MILEASFKLEKTTFSKASNYLYHRNSFSAVIWSLWKRGPSERRSSRMIAQAGQTFQLMMEKTLIQYKKRTIMYRIIMAHKKLERTRAMRNGT